MARRVAVEALGGLKDYKEIRVVFNPPSSSAEFVLLSDALNELGEKSELAALLVSPFATSSRDPGVLQCIDMMLPHAGER